MFESDLILGRLISLHFAVTALLTRSKRLRGRGQARRPDGGAVLRLAI